MTQRWILDEIVDPYGAKVLVERDQDGQVTASRFDLAGLPRVDALLAGQPIAGVPNLVEKLCGICPATHHLAGVRALESLVGVSRLTPTAEAVRRLLHHAAALEIVAPRLLATDRELALSLRRFAKAAMAAAGSPGHFPSTAVPGGVRAPVAAADAVALAEQLPALLRAAVALAEARLVDRPGQASDFDGADVALVDASGVPDLLGTRLRAVAADGTVLVDGAEAWAWDELIAEQFPGASAPRPYLVALGPEQGRYRVGPVAQLRVGVLATPVAAGLQQRWLSDGSADTARAVLTVHALEEIAVLLDRPELVAGEVQVRVADHASGAIGVGWVDGPRGLLVHRYTAGADGLLAQAVILTPTAQNEPWLADLLRGVAAGRSTEAAMEDAIREADPCLPCSSAPAGAMGLQVETVAAAAREVD